MPLGVDYYMTLYSVSNHDVLIWSTGIDQENHGRSLTREAREYMFCCWVGLFPTKGTQYISICAHCVKKWSIPIISMFSVHQMLFYTEVSDSSHFFSYLSPCWVELECLISLGNIQCYRPRANSVQIGMNMALWIISAMHKRSLKEICHGFFLLFQLTQFESLIYHL